MPLCCPPLFAYGSTPRSVSIAVSFVHHNSYFGAKLTARKLPMFGSPTGGRGCRAWRVTFYLKFCIGPLAACGTCKTVFNPSNILLQAPGHTRLRLTATHSYPLFTHCFLAVTVFKKAFLIGGSNRPQTPAPSSRLNGLVYFIFTTTFFHPSLHP